MYNFSNIVNNQNKELLKKMEKSSTTQKAKTKSKKAWIFEYHVWWMDALVFIGGTILLGGLASLLGGKMFHFENFKMPPATVPKIVFPFAWAIIYVAIGISTFLMWRDKEIKEKNRKFNLVLYFIHMFFNVLWPFFFFRFNLPIVAVIWILFVIASAIVTLYRYFIANLSAGIIFCVYCAWLVYALYLNLGLVLINF